MVSRLSSRTTRPPSSTDTSRSSSSASSTVGSPRALASSIVSNAIPSTNSSKRNSSVGRQSLTAQSAALNLRTFNRSRRPGVLEKLDALHSSPVPMEELMLDLKGGNGRKKKQKAEEEIERRLTLQAEKDLQTKLEENLRRKLQKEREDELRRAFEEQEAKQRIFEEEQLQEQARLEKENLLREQELQHQQAEAARRTQLQQPKQCDTCGGNGLCSSCGGTGCISVTYLTSAVDSSLHNSTFRGRTLSGCTSCGGRHDGRELLHMDIVKGHGHCCACRGKGQIKLSEEEIEAAMQEAADSLDVCDHEIEAAMQQAAILHIC